MMATKLNTATTDMVVLAGAEAVVGGLGAAVATTATGAWTTPTVGTVTWEAAVVPFLMVFSDVLRLAGVMEPAEAVAAVALAAEAMDLKVALIPTRRAAAQVDVMEHPVKNTNSFDWISPIPWAKATA